MNDHWKNHSRHYDEIITQNPRYLAMIEFHAGSLDGCDYVLDSGAGTGNLTFRLLAKGKRVCAVDNNPDMLDKLRNKCKDYADRLQIKKIDLTLPLEFANSTFAGIASSYVVPYVNNPIYLSENFRVLRGGGVFSLSALMPERDISEFMMGFLEKILLSKGMLPEFQEQWERFKATSKTNEKMILERGIPKDELVKILNNLGFHIEDCESAYGKYVAFLKCRK